MPAFGKVKARLVTYTVDSDDADQEPDVLPLAGMVTFTLNVPRLTELSADPVPTVIASSPFVAILDDEGYLSTPDSSMTGVQYRDIWLPANDDPNLNPTETQYIVSYSLTIKGTNTIVTLPDHPLALPAGSTIDLAGIMPPASAPILGTAAAEAAAVLAAQKADEAVQLLETASDEIITRVSDDLDPLLSDLITTDGTSSNLLLISTVNAAVAASKLSAYDIAVDNGFIGTELEWLESLEGTDGLSAYQQAVAGGFVGTEAEWLASLKGVDGTGTIASLIAGDNITIDDTDPNNPIIGLGPLTLTKDDVGLANVDNTADIDKPASNAVITLLEEKANVGHSHSVIDLTTTGTRDTTTYLRGDGRWFTPPDTTYDILPLGEAVSSTSTVPGLTTGERLAQAFTSSFSATGIQNQVDNKADRGDLLIDGITTEALLSTMPAGIYIVEP